MNLALIENLVEGHEGRKYVVYRDTLGNLSIGIGCNLEAPGCEELFDRLGISYSGAIGGTLTLDNAQIDAIFEAQLSVAIREAATLVPSFENLPDEAQAVVVDMVFNLGASGFAQFVRLRSALAIPDYLKAAEQICASEWCAQVGERCQDDAQRMRQCAVQ